jgi:hypothetical protein
MATRGRSDRTCDLVFINYQSLVVWYIRVTCDFWACMNRIIVHMNHTVHAWPGITPRAENSKVERRRELAAQTVE